MYKTKLYPNITILLSHDLLVLFNHAKTHTLIYYLNLVLKVLNSWFIHKYFSFSHFYSQQSLCEKLCCMIIWSWFSIVSSCFYCGRFSISMFLHIFYSLPKNCIIYLFVFKIISCCFLDVCSYQYIVLTRHFD